MTESSKSSEEDLAAAADSDYACPDSKSTSHDDRSSDSDDHIAQYTETEESVTKASAHRQALVQIPVMFMAMHSESLHSLWQSPPVIPSKSMPYPHDESPIGNMPVDAVK